MVRKFARLTLVVCLVLITTISFSLVACTKTTLTSSSPVPTSTAPTTTTTQATTTNSQNPAPTAASPIKWTFSHMAWDSPFGWGFANYPRFQDMVKEATGGRLILESKIDLLPVGETFVGVADGRADIGFQPISYISGTFPILDFGDVPFLFGHIFEYEKMVNDPDMQAILNKVHQDAGVVKIFDCTSERSDAVFSNKPIKITDDYKGFKIRTAGVLITDSIKALGGSPMTIASGDLQQALASGVVDGVHTSIGFGLSTGMADMTKYLSFWSFQPAYPGEVIANKKKFDALPPDLQKILLDVGKQYQSQVFFAADSYYRMAKLGIKATKLQIIQPDQAEVAKVRNLTQPIIDQWLKMAGPNGPQVMNIVKKYAYTMQVKQ